MSHPLYNIALGLYRGAVRLAALRPGKARSLVHGQCAAVRSLQQAVDAKAPDGFDWWIHAASLGEFEQARPLIELINRRHPAHKILLTFYSPSGYNVRKDYDRVTAVTYLPADTPGAMARFVAAARARRVVIVKYEVWPNMLESLRAKGTPVYLMSAIFRPGQIYFKPWGGMMRRALRTFSRLFVQDNDSKALLTGIGIPAAHIHVTGDTRFDRVQAIKDAAAAFPALEDWSRGHFTIVAGSSWPADEDRYIPWLNAHPGVRAVIAPHEFDSARIAALQERLQGKSVAWSTLRPGQPIPRDTQTVILDTFGMLSAVYRYGTVAIVGGGLGSGIHNINEAAVYGMPVLFGPRHGKFKEARDMLALGAAHSYNGRPSLEKLLDNYLDDPGAVKAHGNLALEYVNANLGATLDVYNKIIQSEPSL